MEEIDETNYMLAVGLIEEYVKEWPLHAHLRRHSLCYWASRLNRWDLVPDKILVELEML